MSSDSKPLITIFHFNDVYNIQPNSKGEGGICNFKAELECYRQKLKKQQCITLFSGDAFSPSMLSMVLRGQQMVHSLNQLAIDCACYGNHEFDLQPKETISLSKKSNFDWLLGNIKYKNSGQLLGDGSAYKIIEKNGLKIGLFGVAGNDWLGILPQQYQDQLQFIDEIEHSKKIVETLEQQEKCDLIIALTHMRVLADQKLAEKVPRIDISLGGHDHIKYQKSIDKVPVFKSGSDFRNFRVIQVVPRTIDTLNNHIGTNLKDKQIMNGFKQYDGRRFIFRSKLVQVGIHQKVDEDLRKYVEQSLQKVQTQNKVIGYTNCPLQIRFNKIRAEQTNYGNFVTDLCKLYYNADACIINSGSIRNDYVVQKGPIRFPVIKQFIDGLVVVKKVPGYILLKALQKSCQSLPDQLSGSFLQVSGIKYSYDCSKPQGQKIVSVEIKNAQLQLDKQYKIAMQNYIAKGGDGFFMLRDCCYALQLTSCLNNPQIIQRFFRTADIKKKENQSLIKNIFANMNALKNRSLECLPTLNKPKPSKQNNNNFGHRYKSFTNLQRKQIELENGNNNILLSEEESQSESNSQQLLILVPQSLKRTQSVSLQYDRMNILRKNITIDQKGNSFACIEPKVEGRIKCINHQYH